MRDETYGTASGEKALKRTECFVKESGEMGDAVLSAFNEVDFAHCDMPDEYLSYAKKFMQAVQDEGLNIPKLLEKVWCNHVGDHIADIVVRKCIAASQIIGGFVKTEQLRAICEGIHRRLQEIHERHECEDYPA